MDRDQSLRRMAEVISGKTDKDYYEFEGNTDIDLLHFPRSQVKIHCCTRAEAGNKHITLPANYFKIKLCLLKHYEHLTRWNM